MGRRRFRDSHPCPRVGVCEHVWDVPELPDLQIYLDALADRIVGEVLERIRLKSLFVLRSVDPPISEAEGKRVTGLSRIGKRIVWRLEDDLHLVFHLMIAGRFQWRKKGAKPPGRIGLAMFDFPNGTLLLTEAASRKRASLHLVRGSDALQEFDRGGLEVMGCGVAAFREALGRGNHTLKRGLTDPHLLSGIGNAYSDEILHRAKLSPFKRPGSLSDADWQRLYDVTQEVVQEWIDRLRAETGDRWPSKVTAFRDDMAVHGKYGEPCPDCGTRVQRILYAENEANYCPACQTAGKLLADRVLSKLMKDDWPKTIEELEERRDRLRE